MTNQEITISPAEFDDFSAVGGIMASEYSRLEGFPSRKDQPGYYEQFNKLEKLCSPDSTQLIVAKNQANLVLGGVIFFSDMRRYGAGGEATTSIVNAAGIRLLAVSSEAQGKGVGRKLTHFCVELAKQSGKSRVILHTTQYMKTAWKLYESMGFSRYSEIDFSQGKLDVFGFQLTFT